MRTCLRGLIALSLVVLAGCTLPAPPAPPAAAAVSRATILAVRPIGAAAPDDVLTRIGSTASAATASPARREFILRTDEGRILSIVQEDDGTAQTGQPVTLTGGERARFAAGG